MFAAYHQMCQPITSSSTVSTSRRADALLPTGSVHLAGQGRPGYNRWKRITGAQSTWCGHWRRIARCGGRYGPRWSGAAVSEWSSLGSSREDWEGLDMSLSACLKCSHDLQFLFNRPIFQRLLQVRLYPQRLPNENLWGPLKQDSFALPVTQPATSKRWSSKRW